MKLAYLYSRYPIISQTFCDNEMLALESRGGDLTVGSIYPPLDSLRHDNLDHLQAPVLYAPPPRVIAELEQAARKSGRWPQAMIDRHDREYGKSYRAATRARNALYFADQCQRLGIRHVHVHFANRATHTALFLREMTGVTLSFTTHGQDFMVDLGSDALLNEMCEASAFVVAVCDYSRALMIEKCPVSRDKIVRIYNGLDPQQFTMRPSSQKTKGAAEEGAELRILSVGRLIEFKGFHLLIDAVAALHTMGVDATLRIIGEGPWQEKLTQKITAHNLTHAVTLLGKRSSTEVSRELAETDVFALGCVVDAQGASDLLPTVITEAMLTGLPVVSTTVAGVPEMIVDGETGFIVPPNDPQALAQALQQLANAPERRVAMGKAGRRRAEALFALEVTVPQLERHFQSALASHQPPEVKKSHGSSQSTAPTYGFFDLSLPRRREWLEAEASVIQSAGGHIIAAGGTAGKQTIQGLRPTLSGLEWMPDGMVLEMEWRMRAEWRMQLEMLRTSLSTSVDGAVFLQASRRAVWLAGHLQKSKPLPTLLYAPGVEESLSVWLTGKLANIPVALAFESGTDWSGNLLRTMAKDSVLLSNATDKIKTTADVLHHGVQVVKRGHIGRLRWQKTAPSPSRKLRKEALQSWLQSHSLQPINATSESQP